MRSGWGFELSTISFLLFGGHGEARADQPLNSADSLNVQTELHEGAVDAKHGPMMKMGMGLASLYHDYQFHIASHPHALFQSSQSLIHVMSMGEAGMGVAIE